MAFLGDSDIDAMLTDLSALDGTVDVTIGGTTVKGLYDEEAQELLGGDMPGVIGTDKVVHVKTGALSGLVPGVSITVGGTAYKAREVLPYGDGAMTRVFLSSTS